MLKLNDKKTKKCIICDCKRFCIWLTVAQFKIFFLNLCENLEIWEKFITQTRKHLVDSEPIGALFCTWRQAMLVRWKETENWVTALLSVFGIRILYIYSRILFKDIIREYVYLEGSPGFILPLFYYHVNIPLGMDFPSYCWNTPQGKGNASTHCPLCNSTTASLRHDPMVYVIYTCTSL